MLTTFEAALWWLGQGLQIVPLQPGSKRQVQGYGAYLEKIAGEAGARFWFRDRACNLGVVCGGDRGLVCLDFDQVQDYERWRSVPPGADVETLVERSRRGFHVFVFAGQDAGRLRSGPAPGGFEIKGPGSVVCASPSVVSGFRYHPIGDNAVASVSAARLDLPLLSDLQSDVPLSKLSRRESGDVVSRIKAYYHLVEFAGVYKLRGLTADGRWWHAFCPFHLDIRKRSFWIDHERNTFGCFGCDAHGDVINFYARMEGLTVGEAITKMAQGLP